MRYSMSMMGCASIAVLHAIAVSGLADVLPTPVIEYDFNTPSGTATYANSGSAGSAWNLSTLGQAMLYTEAGGNPLGYTPSNSPTSVSGRVPSAVYQYSGYHDGFYSSATDKTTLDGLTGFTLVMWVRAPSTTTRARLISYHNETTSAGFDFYLAGTNNAYLNLRVDGVAASAMSNVGISTEWNYVAVTYDGSASTGNVSYYMGNGTTLSAAGTANLNAGTTGDPGAIMLALMNHATLNRNTNGLFDNVGIYNSVLSAGQISQLMMVNDIAAVPEPASLACLAIGGAALLAARKRPA